MRPSSSWSASVSAWWAASRTSPRSDELTSAVELRRPHPADLEAVAALHWRSWLRSYGPLLTPDQQRLLTLDERRAAWRPVLAGEQAGTYAWVAESSISPRRIVGIALAHLAEDPVRADADADVHSIYRPDDPSDPDGTDVGEGVVHSIHVDPDVQGRGIGRRLLEASLDDLRRAGCHAATLTVLAGNAPARAFYEHLGWSLDGPPFAEPMSGLEALPMVAVVRYRLAIQG